MKIQLFDYTGFNEEDSISKFEPVEEKELKGNVEIPDGGKAVITLDDGRKLIIEISEWGNISLE